MEGPWQREFQTLHRTNTEIIKSTLTELNTDTRQRAVPLQGGISLVQSILKEKNTVPGFAPDRFDEGIDHRMEQIDPEDDGEQRRRKGGIFVNLPPEILDEIFIHLPNLLMYGI
ncbi:hypothetical protein PAAG_11285 [Paracoccidioides lutzii Pb01]|uniref:Uncharacterized protein n=1 Tax=Paracoccidioides lutzii (strain ATCC MYA-826 / Pb01) TaxID=502779 RepID=A0A0A2V6Z9_PARBA|nr:hypothetical protein PAAG_11285 [Paracoccidioides lutzii Pb01]KGQ01895.1 hypothetical protein PAAG_11285 [Paracoccidioides lutzii Pb01]